ncbi:MAG: tail fiber domain-containing protein [Saprospiraceae bacterium]|nr:tail fiber domain-containing protein [Saprospiraceae bacterium]
MKEKTNIKNIKYGLNDVMKLRPVSFEWIKNREAGTKLGLIAQELKEVVSEVVVLGDGKLLSDNNETTNSEEGRYGVFYSDLIPVLIKAIQEQQEMINVLRQEVDAIKKQSKK